MVNIEKALEIDGWMNEVELKWLAEQASMYKMIVEVGSYIGRSTRALADNTSGRIIAVDTWSDDWKVEVEKYDPYALEIINKHPNPFQEFLTNLNDHILRGKVSPCIGTIKNLSIIEADMVFIDGSHLYQNVYNDIIDALALEPVLLCGHDYGDPIWPEVTEIVDKLFDDFLVIPKTSIWFRFPNKNKITEASSA